MILWSAPVFIELRSRDHELQSSKVKDQKIRSKNDQRSKGQKVWGSKIKKRSTQIKRSKFKGQLRPRDQRSKINSEQLRSKDQSSKINADQRIKTQIKMVSKFSKELCLILSFWLTLDALKFSKDLCGKIVDKFRVQFLQSLAPLLFFLSVDSKCAWVKWRENSF